MMAVRNSTNFKLSCGVLPGSSMLLPRLSASDQLLCSIQHAGEPWEIGLAETHQTLVINGLLRVERFQDGDLGIHLKYREGLQPAVQAPAAAQTVLLGDSIYRPFPPDPDPGLTRESLDEYGNPLPET